GPFPFDRTGADMTNSRQAPLILALAIGAALALGACESKLAGRSEPVQAPPPKPETGTVVPPPPPAEAAPGEAPVVIQPVGGEQRVRVALLVPLSGPNATVGRALLDAAQLAV